MIIKKILPWLGTVAFFCWMYWSYTRLGHSHSWSPLGDNEGYAREYQMNKRIDGTHQAIVEYFSPAKGKKSENNLLVEVSNNQVKNIYFPKYEGIDSKLIHPAIIDENGEALLLDDDGKTYKVYIKE